MMMKIMALFMVMVSSSVWASKPNIVFIMFDDLDILDLSSYQPNSLIHTPYLDSFFDQNESLVFENYYASGPNCSQTRSSLLSGQFPIQNNFLKTLDKDGPMGISIDFPMVSEKLKDAGYYTATIGKWHVGLDGDPTFRPENRGFDYSTVWYEDRCDVITCPSVTNDDGTPLPTTPVDLEAKYRGNLYDGKYFGYKLTKQNSFLPNPTVSCHQVYNEVNGVCTAPVLDNYLPNLLTDETTALIDTVNDTILATPAHEPFFINLWYFTPHVPYNTPPNYENLFKCGQVGEVVEACQYQLDYTIINDVYQEISDCNGGERTPLCDAKLGRYAAQMTYVDQQIKKVEDKIQKMYDAGKLNNETFIVITSDNGGAPAVHSNWGGDVTANSRNDSVLCTNGDEANCDIKYRGAKIQLFERGIRAPLAIKRFGAANNTTKGVSDEFITSRDFFPTIVNLATESLDTFNYYGTDFSKVINNNEALSFFDQKRSEYWQMRPGASYVADFPTNYDEFVQHAVNNDPLPFPEFETDYTGSNSYKQNQEFAIRQGDWKLIYEPQRFISLANGFLELTDEVYDLYEIKANDNQVDEAIGAKKNADRPDLVAFLQNQYYKWRNLVGFIDYDFEIVPNMVDGLIDINSHCPNGPGSQGCDTVAIEHSTRLNIAASQFTYANYVKINSGGTTCGSRPDGLAEGNGVISFKPGDLVDGKLQPASWKMKIDDGKAWLRIWLTNKAQDAQPKTVTFISDQPLVCDQVHHLAFTIQGSKPSGHGQVIKFFVDGQEEGRHTTVNFVREIDNDVSPKLSGCFDQLATTYCPPHWEDIQIGDTRPRVANSHRQVFIGNDVQQNRIFDGFISPPLISTATLSNEEVRMLSLARSMNENYADNKISYVPCVDSSAPCAVSAAASGVPGPVYDSELDAWFFPFDGADGLGAPNNVVLELKDDPNSVATLDSDQLSFTTKIRLNQYAMKAPQAENYIAAQTGLTAGSQAAHAWTLKVDQNPNTPEENDGLIKLTTWFGSGSCKRVLKTQGTNPAGAGFAVIKEGEAHDIGVAIDKINKTSKLYLNGQEILSDTATACGSMVSHDNLYLGNFYRDCSIQGDPFNCRAFDGYIYAPRISNQLLSDDGFAWESRTQHLE